MFRRSVTSFLLTLAAVPAVFLAGGAAPAAAADDGLSVASTTSFTIDATSGVVHVRADMSLTNTIPDQRHGNFISRRYFTGFSLPAPAGALNPVATTTGGRGLRVAPRLVPGNSNYFVYDISLAGNLFYRQTTHFDVTYDIAGPRAITLVDDQPFADVPLESGELASI